MKRTPLAELIRPTSFDDIVGQSHLFGTGGVVRRLCNSGRIPNMIFYGPPGTGKTTSAALVAKYADMTFVRLNATTASLSDVKDVLASTENVFGSEGILLYLDEIQYFNRKQQQSLLEYIEDGRVTLIASTTENPHFYLYGALISRSTLFEFKPVPPSEVVRALARGMDYLNREANRDRSFDDGVAEKIAAASGGDVRRALTLFENAYLSSDGDKITLADVTPFESNIADYSDDIHYDLLSALQKSIRGSDPDAAVFYLNKLLAAGELLSVCRRMQVIASEDIGLAYPLAPVITRACCESARELGMPEARIPLSNAAVMLATAPKSNSAYLAAAAACEDIAAGRGKVPPKHIQSPLFEGYVYPHDFPNHYTPQQYLPDELRDRVYYKYGENKTETAAAAYADGIKSRKKGS